MPCLKRRSAGTRETTENTEKHRDKAKRREPCSLDDGNLGMTLLRLKISSVFLCALSGKDFVFLCDSVAPW
jgi:hypothetical protein